MPSLTVRDIAPDVLRDLRAAARARHRSLNAHVLACLEEARLREQVQGDLDELLREIDRHARRTARRSQGDSAALIRQIREAR